MNIKKRIYDDFFRPSKIDEYEEIIKTAKENNYEFHTVLSFEKVRENPDPNKKYLINRRDIDTADSYILEQMFAIEQRYGARATYYFRRNTMNLGLMLKIQNGGGESSYHYEELASFCYKHRIRDKETALLNITKIQQSFVDNISWFRSKTGLPCLTVASHGDYINTKLQVQNHVLMNGDVRNKTGIIREAYDKEHMGVLTCRLADQILGDNFTKEAIGAIKRGEHVLELLTHPRQWNSPIIINLKEEIQRICKQLYMMRL